MAKKVKHERPSLERMITESPELMKIAENFQIEVQVKEIQRTIDLLEDRIAQSARSRLGCGYQF